MMCARRVQPDVMDIALGFVVIAVAVAVAVAVMLVVRRRAPEGSYLSAGDRQARDALGQNDPLPCNAQGQPQ
jgi:hypothetical protein